MSAPQPGGESAKKKGATQNSWEAGEANEEKWWLSDGEEESDEDAKPPSPKKDDLYDSSEDVKARQGPAGHDDAWVSRQRQGRGSDAILSCPGCLETLTLDCQRHEKYETQFRAMFVSNCKVERGERLRVPAQGGGKGRPKAGKQGGGAAAGGGRGAQAGQGQDTDDLYHPVKCATCNHEVGVLDSDDVYHFFDVVATTA